MRRIGYEDERITHFNRIWREGRCGGSKGAKPALVTGFGSYPPVTSMRGSRHGYPKASIFIYLLVLTHVSSEPRVFRLDK